MIQYVPMEARHIDNGKFLKKLNTAVGDAQHLLGDHLKKHGEKSKGGSVTITAKVVLSIADPADAMTNIKSSVGMTRPTDPASIMRGNLIEGRPVKDGEPAQMEIFVKTGFPVDDSKPKMQKNMPFGKVDTETGEVEVTKPVE